MGVPRSIQAIVVAAAGFIAPAYFAQGTDWNAMEWTPLAMALPILYFGAVVLLALLVLGSQGKQLTSAEANAIVNNNSGGLTQKIVPQILCVLLVVISIYFIQSVR